VFKSVGEYFIVTKLEEGEGHHETENGPFYLVKSINKEKLGNIKVKADA
jgi:hypothetical protein